MIIREVGSSEEKAYNEVVKHPLQSWEWGEFRQSTGQKVIRLGCFEKTKISSGFQVLLNYIPKTNYTVGTLLRGPAPDKTMLESLKKVGQEHNTIFFKIEPLVPNQNDNENQDNFLKVKTFLLDNDCQEGKPLFPNHTFWLDLSLPEDKLLAAMHPKTRYNVNLSQKHGVKVIEDNSPEGFKIFLKLHFETAKREGFYSHSPAYHQKMWDILHPTGIAHLLIAKYQGIPLASWVLFVFNQTLYYPYGGSTREHREVMPSYAIMWQTIKFGKKMGCKNFDMWGTPGSDPKPEDPWFGFHRFKLGFGPKLVEFVGSYDYVLNSPAYRIYNIADDFRWKFLRTKIKITSLGQIVKNYVSKYTSST